MGWEVIQENQREQADESYYFKAEMTCSDGLLIFEISWAQIMYAVTVDLVVGNKEPESIYGCMVFCEDRVEKYAHQIMRMTEKFPLERFRRLDRFQKDAVLNYNLSTKFGVTYKSCLPVKVNDA